MILTLRHVASTAICLSLSLAAAAADLWVAPNGLAGNAGTELSPKDLASAASSATPGTVVRLKAGVYTKRLVVGVSGSAGGGYVTFKGEAGAIIDGSTIAIPSGDWKGLIEIDARSYIRIENIEVRNWKTAASGILPVGILVRSAAGPAANIQIVGNHVHNIWQTNGADGAHGIAAYGKNATALTGLVIANNEVDHCRLSWSEAMVVNGNVDGFQVTGNQVHHNNNIGIDLIGYEGEAPSNDQVRNGLIRDNVVWAIHTGGYGDAGSANAAYASGDDSAGGIYVDGGKDIVIERNLVYDCDICIEVGAEHGPVGGVERNTQRITVRDNIAYGAKQGVLMLGGYNTSLGWTENCLVVGNTFWKANLNNSGSGVVVLQKTRNNQIRSNIIVATGSAAITANMASGVNNTGNTFDWNLYWAVGTPSYQVVSGTTSTGLAAHRTASGQDMHSLQVNPLFVSTSAGTENLHIQPTSPAVGAGDSAFVAASGETDIDGQARVQGGRVDIGADEIVVTVTGNTAPTVATAASVSPSPSPVTGTTAVLSVLGADDAGESALTYTWSTTGTPPAAVTFSANGTNTAKASTATFTKAGVYAFQVIIRDAGSLTVTSSVSATVNQTLTTVSVAPTTTTLGNSGTQQFTATAKDQFATALITAPVIAWNLATGGVGGVSAIGLYTAPASGPGSATVQAVAGGKTGTAAVVVTEPGNTAPTVVTAASADATPVSPGTGTTVRVTASDVDGDALSYAWSTTSGPGTASFATATAANSAVTFSSSGTYVLRVTISDGKGGSVFSEVTVNATSFPLNSLAIGTSTLGSYSDNGSSITVAGSGSDIWNSSDGFQFASQSLNGDGTIVVRVASLQNTNAWAKAGVMVREGTASGAKFAFCCVTPGKGVAFQRRTATNRAASHTAGSANSAPRWLKLTRTGSLLKGFESADGQTWTLVGSVTISMTNPVQIGLAVTSHNNGVLCTAVFDQLLITPSGNG